MKPRGARRPTRPSQPPGPVQRCTAFERAQEAPSPSAANPVTPIPLAMSSRPTAPATSAAPPKARPAQLAGDATATGVPVSAAARGSGRSINVLSEAQLHAQQRGTAARSGNGSTLCQLTTYVIRCRSGIWWRPSRICWAPDADSRPALLQAAPLRPLPEGIDPGLTWTQRTGRPEATGPLPMHPRQRRQQPS